MWVAVAPTDPEVRDFWTAAAERDGAPVRFGVEAWSAPEVVRAVAYLDNVITAYPSLPRFYSVPGVVAVPLADVSPAPMSLMWRAGDRRRVVAAFRTAVLRVSARMIHLVPGAGLAPALMSAQTRVGRARNVGVRGRRAVPPRTPR